MGILCNILTPFGSTQACEEKCVILFQQSSYITTLVLSKGIIINLRTVFKPMGHYF
jgi:hypothetical protein